MLLMIVRVLCHYTSCILNELQSMWCFDVTQWGRVSGIYDSIVSETIPATADDDDASVLMELSHLSFVDLYLLFYCFWDYSTSILLFLRLFLLWLMMMFLYNWNHLIYRFACSVFIILLFQWLFYFYSNVFKTIPAAADDDDAVQLEPSYLSSCFFCIYYFMVSETILLLFYCFKTISAV